MSIVTELWKAKILRLFLADKTALKFVLGYISTFCTIGCFVGIPAPSNYILLKTFAPMWVWGCLFGVLSIFRLAGGFKIFSDGVEAIIAIVGLWLWSYLAVSFMVADTTPLAPFELMLLGIIFGEIWLLTHSLFFHDGDWRKVWGR